MTVRFRLMQFVLDPAVLGLPPEVPCDAGCGWTLGKGSLVKATPLGLYHTPCLPRDQHQYACCPHCLEQHEQPFDGGCLL